MPGEEEKVTLAELAARAAKEAEGKEAEPPADQADKPEEQATGEEEGKLLLGRFKSEEELAEYVRSLEERAKKAEEADSEDEEDEEEAEAEAPKAEQPKPLSDEERQKLNESFLEDFYADPLGTQLKLVTAVVRQLVQAELYPLLQPLQEYVATSTTQAELNRLAEEVARENEDFADHVEEMEQVFREHPELARMGKAGFELALSRARDLKARKARAATAKAAVGINAGSRPAGQGKVKLEDLFRKAIREAVVDTKI